MSQSQRRLAKPTKSLPAAAGKRKSDSASPARRKASQPQTRRPAGPAARSGVARSSAAKRRVADAADDGGPSDHDDESDIVSDLSDTEPTPLDADDGLVSSDSDAADAETADERRLRIAKEALHRIQREEAERAAADVQDSDDDDDDDDGGADGGGGGGGDASSSARTATGPRTHRERLDADPVARRLAQEALVASGRFEREISAQWRALPATPAAPIRFVRAHRQSLTCQALTHDDRTVYTGAKDGFLLSIDVDTGKRTVFAAPAPSVRLGHKGPIQAVAVSSDGRLLASGGDDETVHLWDTRTAAHVHALTGHRDVVSGVVFRFGTHQVYSCSRDRSVKVWDGSECTYVETLYGHQAEVTCIDAFMKERCLTGAYDKTARLWKVMEGSQLLFDEQHTASVDCCRMLSDEAFLTGSQDGSIALWTSMRRRPVSSVRNAHGIDPASGVSRWLSALAVVPRGDIVVSGSNSGQLRLWTVVNGRRLSPLANIPLAGWINALNVSTDGRFIVAGVAPEHRLGRWAVSAVQSGVNFVPMRAEH